MGKNKNNKKNVTLSAKSSKNTVANPTQEVKKPEVKVEEPKVETPTQVAPAETPVATPIKEPVKTPEKKEEKKAEPKKPEPKKEEPKKEEKKTKTKKEHIPTIVPEDVTDNTAEKALERAKGITNAIPVGSSESSLNGKAMLANVMWEKYGKNQELAKNYPELYNDLMGNLDVVVLLGLVDVRQEMINKHTSGELSLTVAPENILHLQSMADMLGIKLAPAKALPGNDGQLSIDFKESVVPEELTKDAGKSEGREVPELDPSKINSDEEVIEALKYLLSNGKNTAENVVNTVEWYRTYNIKKASGADEILKFDNYTVGDWMHDIFHKVTPTSLVTGLGRSLYLLTKNTGSPCMAHTILHKNISKMGWSEDQIASTLKCFLTEKIRYELKTDDPKELANDKVIQILLSSIGNDYINEIVNNFDVTLTGDKDKDSALLEKRNRSRMVIGAVRQNYFDPSAKISPDEVRMTIGRIINLYRDPADRLEEYCGEEFIPAEEKKN